MSIKQCGIDQRRRPPLHIDDERKIFRDVRYLGRSGSVRLMFGLMSRHLSAHVKKAASDNRHVVLGAMIVLAILRTLLHRLTNVPKKVR